MNLRTRIVLIGMAQLVVIGAVLVVLYYIRARNDLRRTYVEKARSIGTMVEGIREEIARKWKEGVFTAELLRQWADAGETERILSAVPVVTAWRTANEKAEQAAYEFRVPKFEPRNPKNRPDGFEARVLKLLASQNLDEYYEYDPERKAIRYFRPIRLTEECMLCHGDPARSAEYWGNDEGLDPTGAKMEGWKVGEVHGAFEVIQPLDHAGAHLATNIGQATVVIVLLVALGGWVFYRYTSRTIHAVRDIVVSLRDGASQVTAASQQVAGSAQQIAEGASQQAVSLEQTSSAIEQLAGQTRNNAQAAAQAAALGQQAREAASRGNQTTAELDDAMNAINEASVQIGRIIKVIEEIAFQTNLLALNAAVEAARAGEHGKGFAVVADEVRSLAQRTAEASREITSLIEDSVHKARQGAQVADTVRGALEAIATDVTRVTDLLDGIAQASDEQAQGVEQLNAGITQIDRVTQQNAAGAEESASTAQELTAQASMVRQMVDRLTAMVGEDHDAEDRECEASPVTRDRKEGAGE